MARMTSAKGRHQGSALLLTTVTATTSPIQGKLLQPGQIYSLPGRKEDSPGAPQSLLHHLDVTVAKRSGRTRDRRGWTGSRPPDRQDGFACPTPAPKRGQSRSSSLTSTSSWQGEPCRSVPGLWGHCLHCLLNKKSLRNIIYRPREWPHIFTSDHLWLLYVPGIMSSKLTANYQESPGTGFPAGPCYPRPWRLSKTWLDQALSNLVWSHSCPCPEREFGPETSWGLFLPDFSWDPLLFDLLTQTRALLTIYYPGQQVLRSPTPLQGFWGQFTTKAERGTLLQPGRSLEQGSPSGPTEKLLTHTGLGVKKCRDKQCLSYKEGFSRFLCKLLLLAVRFYCSSYFFRIERKPIWI